jgi:CheY-like chemotaxis protein
MPSKIFYAEDTKSMQLLVCSWLEAAGYEVHAFDDGDALYQQLEDGDLPDLVLSDVNMPHMDGFALCRAMRQLPRAAHLPFVMLTRLDQAQDILNALDAGADAFVVKGRPEARADVLARMLDLLGEQRTRDRALSRSAGDALRLTNGRVELFKTLFGALRRELRFDALVLVVGPEERPRPFVLVSEASLPGVTVDRLKDELAQVTSLMGQERVSPSDFKVQSIEVAGDGLELPQEVPSAGIKVPLLDDGKLVGFLGVFSFRERAVFDGNIRLLFDLGVESARALRRVTLDPDR